jgi:hypothetical protein
MSVDEVPQLLSDDWLVLAIGNLGRCGATTDYVDRTDETCLNC